MSPLLLLSLLTLTVTLPAHASLPRKLAAEDSEAPSPSSFDDGDIEGILEENGQFKTFIRLLDDTHAGDQIDNQLKNNNEQGMTVFAPNDNAFNNLKPGVINDLSGQQKAQLVQYHIVPKYYNLTTLQDVSNPLKTQATGQKGQLWGLNITSQNYQVNVSSGSVVVPVTNALTKEPPLMVFELNAVLLPEELFPESGSKSATAPSEFDASSPPASEDSSATSTTPAGAPKGSKSGAISKDVGRGLLGVLVGLVCLLW